jgi:sugar/nucleoside kinase (ribokinase family)
MEEKSLKRILILGSAVIDVIVTIDRLPLAGEDIPGLQKGMLVGGCAFNVSKILDGLQIPHDLCVPVGQGMYADRIREALHESGHEVLIEDDREDNGYCLSLVEKDGERTFISIDGIETKWQDGWLERFHAADYDYLYASGYGFQDGNSSGEVLLRFLGGKKADAKLILDPGPRLLGKQFEEKLLQLGPILEMNQAEAKAMGQSENVCQAAENLHRRTGQPVIITMGQAGTLLHTTEEEEIIPTVPVKAIDTIGAGDSHTAGFIAALASGKSLREACREANHIAASVVQHVGCSLR